VVSPACVAAKPWYRGPRRPDTSAGVRGGAPAPRIRTSCTGPIYWINETENVRIRTPHTQAEHVDNFRGFSSATSSSARASAVATGPARRPWSSKPSASTRNAAASSSASSGIRSSRPSLSACANTAAARRFEEAVRRRADQDIDREDLAPARLAGWRRRSATSFAGKPRPVHIRSKAPGSRTSGRAVGPARLTMLTPGGVDRRRITGWLRSGPEPRAKRWIR
jgi:hypothetical protein